MKDNQSLFDLHEFPKSSPFYSDLNNSVVGKFQDEAK